MKTPHYLTPNLVFIFRAYHRMHFKYILAIALFQCGVNSFSYSNPTTSAFLKIPPEVITEPFFESGTRVSSSSSSPSPLHPSPSDKPPLLYLPGLDGSGISAITQFNDLDSAFTLHLLHLPPPTRLSFEEVVSVGECGCGCGCG